MTSHDHEAVFSVWERAVAQTHKFLTPKDASEISSLVRNKYIPSADLLVASDGAAVIGFMGMTGLTIDALFIDPSYFGRGVGWGFIEHARERGGPLCVDVNEHNVGAIAFYKRMGFEKVGRSETDGDGRPYPLLQLRECS